MNDILLKSGWAAALSRHKRGHPIVYVTGIGKEHGEDEKETLFTRPRRFGKSLNISMLKSFLRLEMIQLCLKG